MTGKQYVKKTENRYCLVCKKKTYDQEIKGVALVNKIATQRSLCTVCTSRKSTIWKGRKKKNWVFQLIKPGKLIVHDVKNILIIFVQNN